MSLFVSDSINAADTLSASVAAFVQERYGVVAPATGFSVPTDIAHGDLATSVALSLGRAVKQNPAAVAGHIAEHLRTLPSVASCSVAGPGYINIRLASTTLLQELRKVIDACHPQKTRAGEAPVIIEYSGPNIAKPLGIHHISGAVVGQAVSNLYTHGGYPVIRWNYLGDWGTQFGKLAVAINKWGLQKPAAGYTIDELLAQYVRFHVEAENDPILEDQARAAFRSLEQGDPTLRVFWKDVLTVTKASLHTLYERLHVHFDIEYGESFYEDKMQPILQEGKKENVFKEGKGGSWIVEFPEATGLPPYLVQKGDGATLYSTRDLAQMRYRIDTYHPSRILIFTDVAQKLHFEQLLATCKQLQWDLPFFENVLLGRMRFADGNMSTRKGTVLKLEHVLDEAVDRASAVIEERGESIQTDDAQELATIIGTGSLVYGIVSQNRMHDLVFDWEKFLNFEGNSAPYLQYTYARARSVLRKAGGEWPMASLLDLADLSGTERSVCLLLLQYADVLEEARLSHLPHILAHYLYTLAQAFNGFYAKEGILNATEPSRTFRLSLVALLTHVLASGAEILTLRLPESM